MAFISKLQNIISNIPSPIKKGKPIDISKISEIPDTLESKELTKTLDGLAAAKKNLIKRTSPEGYNTFKRDPFSTATKTLIREQAESGSTAQEAINGARALMTATGMPEEITSARISAEHMEELGLFRKMDLKEKYGEKLAAKNAKIEAEKTIKEAEKILAQE